jgi:hypothetical protein
LIQGNWYARIQSSISFDGKNAVLNRLPDDCGADDLTQVHGTVIDITPRSTLWQLHNHLPYQRLLDELIWQKPFRAFLLIVDVHHLLASLLIGCELARGA